MSSPTKTLLPLTYDSLTTNKLLVNLSGDLRVINLHQWIDFRAHSYMIYGNDVSESEHMIMSISNNKLLTILWG